MNAEQFRSQTMGSFEPHPKMERAVELWMDHFRRTEMFDIAHCLRQSERNGHAIPMDSYERGACSANARESQKRLAREMDGADVPHDVRQRAREIAFRQHDSENYKIRRRA